MTAGKSQMEKEISVFGHSNMRVSIRKGKIFHQDLVFAARQSSTFLSQTQNQLYVALKMTFQMLYLAISLLRLDIFLRKKKKKGIRKPISLALSHPKSRQENGALGYGIHRHPDRHTYFQGPSTPPKRPQSAWSCRGNTASLILPSFISL